MRTQINVVRMKTSPELRLEPASYRVMLLRRLRLQLPLVPAFCPCRRRLDALGDHRASCPRSGLLRSRAVPLERAAARVCREAGATVATNVLLRDLNLVSPTVFRFGAVPSSQLTRRLCLPWTRQGKPAATSAPLPVPPYASPARRKSGHTPNYSVPSGAGSLSSELSWVAAGALRLRSSSDSLPAAVREQPHRSCARVPPLRMSPAGLPCFPSQPPVLSQRVSFPSPSRTLPTLMGTPWT